MVTDVAADLAPADIKVCLEGGLRSLLPSARLRLTSIAKLGLDLWLIDPEGMDAPLQGPEAAAVFAEPPYWSFCWGSGLALASAISCGVYDVRSRVVIDFGAGSGVVGIAAAKAGAARVIVCDLDPRALLACRLNAAHNGVELEYLDDFDRLVEAGVLVDMLFAADVLYDPDNRALVEGFASAARQVVIADSRVRDFSAPGYQRQEQVHAVTVPDLGELESVKTVRFYLGGRHTVGRCPAEDETGNTNAADTHGQGT